MNWMYTGLIKFYPLRIFCGENKFKVHIYAVTAQTILIIFIAGCYDLLNSSFFNILLFILIENMKDNWKFIMIFY